MNLAKQIERARDNMLYNNFLYSSCSYGNVKICSQNACFRVDLKNYNSSKNHGISLEEFEKVLKDKRHGIVRYAWIIRDRDCYTCDYVSSYKGVNPEYYWKTDVDFFWPAGEFVNLDYGIRGPIFGQAPGEPMEPYLQVIIWFDYGCRATKEKIAAWFNISPYSIYLNLPELSEHFVLKNLVNAYLPGRYQYSIDEIHSNFDVASIINSINEDYVRLVISAILQGDITRKRKRLQIEPQTLKRFAPLINSAFQFFDKKENVICQLSNSSSIKE